jgi:hypothetical protein
MFQAPSNMLGKWSSIVSEPICRTYLAQSGSGASKWSSFRSASRKPIDSACRHIGGSDGDSVWLLPSW